MEVNPTPLTRRLRGPQGLEVCPGAWTPGRRAVLEAIVLRWLRLLTMPSLVRRALTALLLLTAGVPRAPAAVLEAPTAMAVPGANAGDVTLLPAPMFVAVPGNTHIRPGQEVALRFLLVDQDGLPLPNIPISVNVDRGRVQRFEEAEPGIFEVVYQAASDPGTYRASIQLRAVVREKVIGQSFPVEVQTRQPASLKLTPAAKQLRLGRSTELKVLIEGRGPDGLPLRPESLDIRTNVGQVERLRTLSPGKIEGRFIPGDRRAPMPAIIAVFVGEGEDQTVAWTTIQLVGTPEIPIETEPDSTVWAEVGGVTYGPFDVGPSGSIRVPVNVPPGVRKMVLQVRDSAGNTSRSTQDLSVPRFPHAILRLDRTVTRVDDPQPLTLTLVLIDENGRPAHLPGVPVQVTGGRLGGLVQTAPGTFTASFLPPGRPGRQELRLALPTSDGGEDAFTAAVEVREGVPSQVALKVTPSVLRADDPPAQVSLRVLDKAGNPATGVRATAETGLGGIDAFRLVGPGEYLSVYRPPSTLESWQLNADGEVEVPIRVSLQRVAGTEPAASIRLRSAREVVKASGEAVSVLAQVRDRWGAPVMGVRVRAQVESGDGSISEVQESDSEGWASFRYVPGRKVGPVVLLVSAEAGGPQQRLLILQAVEDRPPGLLERNGSAGELKAESKVTLRPARVKAIHISALPNVLYMDSRQSSEIRVRIEDAAGNFVIDPALSLAASIGQISAQPALKDGYYVAQYTPPVATTPTATARITASNPQREYVGSTELQLVRREGRFLGSVRLGVLSNFGDLTSLSLSFQGMFKTPLKEPFLFVGGSAAYYYWTGTVSTEPGSTFQYDLFPVQVFGCYRHQLGRVTPYIGAGPVLALYRLRFTDVASGAAERMQEWGAFPGLGGMLGLEVGFGPGGIGLEVGVLRTRGGSQLDGSFVVDANLGGLFLNAGYVAHF